MLNLSAFVVITIFLVFISRGPLRAPRSHGFPRFFAWEAMTALTLLNLGAWFRDPFSWNQLISWFLLLVSLTILLLGLWTFYTQGKANGNADSARRSEAGLFAFEKTTQLVTSGIYRTIRHPMYASMFYLTWGVFFKLPSAWGLLLSLIASTLLVATALTDERECIAFFGQPYRDYMQKSRRFIPFLF
jgi:protein-S-isoprenylcysteine O-methyltransferase Ste14